MEKIPVVKSLHVRPHDVELRGTEAHTLADARVRDLSVLKTRCDLRNKNVTVDKRGEPLDQFTDWPDLFLGDGA